ncbi:AMP-binding protein [Streptomyces sp. NBRC 109706]|uniref:AMP-binding protein n=1 Tax=Streptomyces sp. NBRC 109706 TaxID=1550035 RepID=UPI0007813009|nr:AMP-binding protein [Streptomyces sp. NBRC 109706]
MAAEAIHEVFRQRAALRPDATAVVDGARRISYRALDAASDGIAARLADLGVAPGGIVPVLLPPGAPLVATLLGVLKRGAAYAVIDPDWPRERLRRVAAVCGPIALVGPGMPPGVFGRTWTPVVDFAAPPAPAPPVRVRGGDPAMVFFTSGTTGSPKAVLSPHRALLRLLRDCPFAPLGPDTVMPQAAPAPWDAFAFELWGVLLTGGTSVLLDERPLTPAGLRRLVAREGVNLLFLTTSLLHLFVDEDIAAFRGLRQVLTGGEVLSPAHAGRFLAAHPGIGLVNGYGPVESCVFALYHEVSAADVGHDIPIGRPVPGTTVRALVGDRPCRPGEVGELCVGGEGLAIGYVGDRQLTERKFVVVGGERLYRTGDRGTVGASGVFRFAGRDDRQVKLRGHRIELSAVERTAHEVPGVARAVAVPVPGATGNCAALVLYFRAAGAVGRTADETTADEPTADEPTADELTAALRETLPSYARPDAVRALDAFPMTDNGKLDIARLRAMARAEVGAAAAGTSPSTVGGTTAERVAAVFAAVLGRPAVDLDAPFLAQGGTSLDAVRLCTRLGAAHHRPVPVSQLSRTPSVRALAAWLELPPAPPKEPAATGQVPLTPTQLAFLLAHEDSADDRANHCRLGWRITGGLRPDALAAAVADVHRRHPYLGLRYALDDDPVATPGGPETTLEVVAGGDEPDAVLARRLGRPLELRDGLVWRCVLVTTDDPRRWLFGLNVHHIAFDGWSEHLLVDDLATAYAARLNGVPATAAVVDGPAAVRAVLAGIEAADPAAQRAYWADALAELPELALPRSESGRPHTRETPLATDELSALDRAAAALGTGRLTLLLTALGAALRALTGGSDFGVGVPVSLRGGVDSERVVGCLINTVCVRLRPDAPDQPGRTAAAVAGALAHSDLPFPEVVRALGPRAGAARRPLYRVLAAVQDAPSPRLRLPGAVARPWRPEPAAPPAELAVELLTADDPLLRVSTAGEVDARLVDALAAEVSRRLRRLAASTNGG